MLVHASRDARSAASPSSDIIVFDVLLGVALFFTSCTYLLALFSKSLTRMMTWFALIISAWVYCISFLLLVGHQLSGNPSFGLCLFQAGMIYAAPPSVAAAALSFVLEVYLRLTTFMTQRLVDSRIITLLLFLPAVAHQVVFWVSMFTGLANQEAVQMQPQSLFCHVNAALPTTLTGVIVIVSLVIMILVELYTIYYLWRRRAVFREARRHGVGPIFPFKIFIRVGIYTLAGGFGIILVDILLNTSFASESSSAIATIDLLAIVPLSIALVFGTQEDIMQMYIFWRKKKNPPTPLNIRIDVEQGEIGCHSRQDSNDY